MLCSKTVWWEHTTPVTFIFMEVSMNMCYQSHVVLPDTLMGFICERERRMKRERKRESPTHVLPGRFTVDLMLG